MKPSFNDTIALLVAKSNNRTRRQFEYDVTLFFLFFFDFVHLHARGGCCSIVCSRYASCPNETG